MRITSVEAWMVTMPMEIPYAIAYDAVDTATNVLLRLRTSDGLEGVGCAAPDETVTGETPAGALATCRGVLAAALPGEDPFRHEVILARLQDVLAREPSVAAALDMALHDLLAKRAGLPLWKLLGGARDRIETSITVGILPTDETLAQCESWVRRGFRCIKLKGGADVAGDVRRIAHVRERFGGGVRLRFDANQGFTREEAIWFAREAAPFELEFIEQPTPRTNTGDLAAVGRATALPVMADEELLSERDAARFAAEGGVALFNVKLMKVGGIRPALRVIATGAAAGITSMIGCMDETELGIAAGLHLALATPAVSHADLDGHIGLGGDPTAGSLRLTDGVLFPGNAPGLGIRL